MTEFFRVRRVGEALSGFRPAHRVGVERAPLAATTGRVLATDLVATESLPGFVRSALDGFAVRAVDTYGASESLPAYLELQGAVEMGRAAAEALEPGGAVAVATGGAIPEGADAVVMVEHTAETIPGRLEILEPAAPGDGVVRSDEDVAVGAVVIPAGRRLQAGERALLAALGTIEVDVRVRPRVALVSTGNEVRPPQTESLQPGEVRDATASGLAALVSDAGGVPWFAGIVPDDAAALEATLRAAVEGSDLVVVSAGSSVGARDVTASVVERLGEPGIWCHGLAIKPGKPTLLAECGGIPLIGLPGNPLSALLVFRLVGIPLVRLVGGAAEPLATPTVRAPLATDVPSSAGRLDIVTVRLEDGLALPLLGRSSQLSLLTQADGIVLVPEEATGLYAGSEVEVELLQ
jgi:molybdopterin molybdotransferase